MKKDKTDTNKEYAFTIFNTFALFPTLFLTTITVHFTTVFHSILSLISPKASTDKDNRLDNADTKETSTVIPADTRNYGSQGIWLPHAQSAATPQDRPWETVCFMVFSTVCTLLFNTLYPHRNPYTRMYMYPHIYYTPTPSDNPLYAQRTLGHPKI